MSYTRTRVIDTFLSHFKIKGGKRMQNTNKTVIGSYDSRDEAMDVVHKLKNEGYQKQDIILYGNESVTNSIGDHEGVNITAETDTGKHDNPHRGDEDSLWEKIKHAFSTDTYDEDQNEQSTDYDQTDDVLYPYRDDIKNGKIVVAVDNFRGEDIDQYNTVDSDMTANDTVPAPDTMDRTDKRDRDDKDTIQLKEEKLDVDTKGDVRVDDHDTHKGNTPLDKDKNTDKDIADELRRDPNDPTDPPPVDQDKDLGI